MPIGIKRTDGELILEIAGEIDHHRTRFLREELDAAIRQTSAARVVLELSGTDFCDSSGLGLILGRARVCRENGSELYIRDPSPRVKKLLELAGAGEFVRYA